MKILFVAVRYHSNQVPLARALVEAGHDVAFDVLCRGNSEDHRVVEPHVMPLAPKAQRRLERDKPPNLVAYLADRAYPPLRWYVDRMNTLRPDAVVVRDPNRPFALRAAMAARWTRRRVVLYTQGDVHGRPDWRARAMRGAVIASFDAVWISPVPGDERLPRVHPDVHYVPFAADLSRRQKTTWFAGGKVRLLCIGKFTPRKNHLLMVEALHALRHSYEVELTLVGEVSTEEHHAHHAEVMTAITRLGLRDYVSVRTNVPFDDVRELYRQHDVFVLPSRSEPASVSILEAMTHGLPVVCSTTSGTRWYLRPERTGLVFRSDDVDDLVATLSSMLSDPDRLRRMGDAGREVAATIHHPDVVAARLVELIERGRGSK